MAVRVQNGVSFLKIAYSGAGNKNPEQGAEMVSG
jgi:hypothetical protein